MAIAVPPELLDTKPILLLTNSEVRSQTLASSSPQNASVGDRPSDTTSFHEQPAASNDVRGLAQTTEQEMVDGYDEEYKALQTIGVYKDKPLYLDPKGSKGRPYGPPPIQEWADKLIGKRLIAEDAIGDETVCDWFLEHMNPGSLTWFIAQTFKRSDLPAGTIIRPGASDFMVKRRR